MFRYEVPVDGQEHQHLVHGAVVKVAARQWRAGEGPVVEFWAEHRELAPGEIPRPRSFRVFGSGAVLPEGAEWRGTADRDDSGLVWHLYEMNG